ncbi:hypothetical protein DFH06DRAFT_997444, partial [Mycena polygramma]
LLSWADGKRHIYNIHTARVKKDWGVASPFNNTSNIICLEGTSKPVTFWIPGEVSGLWFFNQEGYPAPRPAITVQPLAGGVPEFCRSQLHELFKASRWMTTRAMQGQPAKTQEFKAIYDARKTLRDKAVLQQLTIGQLKLRDFVVLEIRIGRYAVRDEGAADAKGKKRQMDKWQAFYDLEAVYKIKDAIG